MTHNSDHNGCDRHDAQLQQRKPEKQNVPTKKWLSLCSVSEKNIFDILHAPISLIYSVNSVRHPILSHNLRSKGNHSLKEKIMNLI